MPRRNLHLLFLVTIFSLVCYLRVPSSRYSRVMADAMDHVARRYYQPVDEHKLFEGSMQGMMGQLDKYSTYINTSEKQEFQADINKEFGGLGISVIVDPK